ncbi:MAG: SLAP domain-containing protein [Lachnospiraceae bacterium]|nr:SLAP domain-containing protein [Lachnospiraceae bacterium]
MKKRILATMMAVVFSLLAVFPQATAKAEENYTYLLEVTYGLLDGVNTTSCDYTVISDKIQKAYVDFMSEYAKEMKVTLTSMTDYKTSEFTITAQDWVYNSEMQGYLCTVEALFGADTYVITVSSDEYVEYLIMVTAEEAAPTLNTSKLTITAGQKSKLSVYDAAGTVTWSSNKKSVATVTDNGVVKAKKAGKAVITAKVDGYELKCNVVVKKNVYTAAKLTYLDCEYDCVTIAVTKAEYKKGKLVCKVHFVNKKSTKTTYIQNFVIKITDENGKVIAKQKYKKVNMAIPAYGEKTKTFTIKKKNVKKKKADLRCAKTKLSGVSHHVGYYY